MNKLVWILLVLSTYAMGQKLVINEPVSFLALGDSYTIGESVSVPNRWPVQLVDSLQKHGIDCLEPRIIAATGWRTDNLKSAIAKAKFRQKYNLVSLLIGVNNFYQGKTAEQYAGEFESLLITALQLAGGIPSHVFVLSIPDYGYTPFGKNDQEKISIGVDTFNDISKTVANKLGIKYYSTTEISRKGLTEPDLVAPDGLHPSGKMYAAWVEMILHDATLVSAKDSGE